MTIAQPIVYGIVPNFGGSSPVVDTTPKSFDLERDSSQYLSKSGAGFGYYNPKRFAISIWVKQESTGFTSSLFAQGDSAATQRSFYLQNNAGNLDFNISANGSATATGRLVSTATYTSTASFYHFYVQYDSPQATAGNRMSMYVNQSKIAAFDVATYPAQNTEAFNTTPGEVRIGTNVTTGAGTSFVDGLVYQVAFFSNTLPAIGDLHTAGAPKTYEQMLAIPGLFSLAQVRGSDLTTDWAQVTAWTNNNSIAPSTTTP